LLDVRYHEIQWWILAKIYEKVNALGEGKRHLHIGTHGPKIKFSSEILQILGWWWGAVAL
jgi:hypothetical protein